MHSAPMTQTPGSDGRLCKVGGVAALSAGILFRRNLGVEIEAFIESITDVNENTGGRVTRDGRDFSTRCARSK